MLLVCMVSEEIRQCSCGWKLYFVTLQTDIAVQGKMHWTGIALVKLCDCDFTVKRGIKNYLENNLISLSSDSGMRTLQI